MSAPNPSLKDHVALSPEGKIVVIPKWLFDGLVEVVDRKYTGSIEIQVRDGGFAGGELKKMLRNGNGHG